MGNNSLATKSLGQVIAPEDPNQYKQALSGDLFPRNSAGEVGNETASLGSDSVKFKSLHVATGQWVAGDIKLHHSYNGLLSPGQGWFPCLGALINESAYDAIHGAGSWDNYIGVSALDGKYAPGSNDTYFVNKASTPQTGSTAMTKEGNASHLANIDHAHTMGSHNHQVIDFRGSGLTTRLYDVSGARYSITTMNKGSGRGFEASLSGADSVVENATNGGAAYTSMDGQLTSTSNMNGSNLKNIKPDSYAVQYWIRIV